MPISPQSTRLKAVLIQFQTQIEREIDPDDRDQILRWVEDVREVFDKLDEVVDKHRQKVHTKLFIKIGEQDKSRKQQIAELQAADAYVDQLIEVVKSQLIVLSMQSNSEVEARIENQGTNDESVLQLIDRGTELVHWIREQEDLVTAWFAEAFADGVK